jgi:hypothetical protein
VTYVVEGDANADGLGVNDVVYVPRNASDITLADSTDPSQWAALDRFIRGERCLQKRRGRIMRREQLSRALADAREHWQTLLNARLSKEFSTLRGQSVELIADLFNVLNLFDRDWGSSAGTQALGCSVCAATIRQRPGDL